MSTGVPYRVAGRIDGRFELVDPRDVPVGAAPFDSFDAARSALDEYRREFRRSPRTGEPHGGDRGAKNQRVPDLAEILNP
jgi:hypothetical protein